MNRTDAGEAEQLLHQKIHPQTIIHGWRLAANAAKTALAASAVDNGTDKAKFEVCACLRTRPTKHSSSVDLSSPPVVHKTSACIVATCLAPLCVAAPQKTDRPALLHAHQPGAQPTLLILPRCSLDSEPNYVFCVPRSILGRPRPGVRESLFKNKKKLRSIRVILRNVPLMNSQACDGGPGYGLLYSLVRHHAINAINSM